MGDLLSRLSPTAQLAVALVVVAVVATLLVLLRSARIAVRHLRSEVESTSGALLAAQEELRRLSDRDALTGLANRRALPEVFRGCFASGAALIFCDLDHLARINDAEGHATGDATLVRFAKELAAAFRPTDAVVRYAGDEFLVVCPGMTVSMAEDRVDVLRGRFVRKAATEAPVLFSAGVVELPPGGDASIALTAANEAMYAMKSGSRVVARG